MTEHEYEIAVNDTTETFNDGNINGTVAIVWPKKPTEEEISKAVEHSKELISEEYDFEELKKQSPGAEIHILDKGFWKDDELEMWIDFSIEGEDTRETVKIRNDWKDEYYCPTITPEIRKLLEEYRELWTVINYDDAGNDLVLNQIKSVRDTLLDHGFTFVDTKPYTEHCEEA